MNEQELNFHGLCQFINRLHSAGKRGMRAALSGCPKCHFPLLEGLMAAIQTHGQDGRINVSQLAQYFKKPLPVVSRALRQLEEDGLIRREPDPNDRRKTLVEVTPKGYANSRLCEEALSDYFDCVIARLTPEQLSQMIALKDVLMDAIEAENADRETKPKGETNDGKNL